MRPRRGWAVYGRLIVTLGLACSVVVSGCEKTGGNGQAQQTPPSTAPIPPTPTVVGIALTADSDSLVPDGVSSTTITAQLITSTGATAPDGTVVIFTTDLGRFTADGAKSISATTSQGTGTVIVPFISEPGVVGIATIVASVQNVTQSIQITLGVPSPPSPPPGPIVGLTLEAEETTLFADGVSSTTITATVTTSTGVPVPDGTLVTFTTDIGRFSTTGAKTLSAATTQGQGTAIVPFISEQGVTGTAIVVANIENLTQSLLIQLIPSTASPPPPGPVVGINVASGTPSLVADGFSSTIVTALLFTSTGAPAADGTEVTFTTDLGRFTTAGAKSITAVTTQGTGTAVVPFLSEPSVVGTATVVVTAEGLTQSVAINLTAVPPPPPSTSDIAGITLMAAASALPADGVSSTTIAASVITSTGVPAPNGIAVNFATDLGKFTAGGAKFATATTGQDAGLAVVPFISEAGVVGTATIVAQAGNVTQSIQIDLGSPIPPPPPPGSIVGITLSAGSNSLVANGTTSTTITAILLTSTGNPAPDGVTVNFTTDRGQFSTDGSKTAAATTSNGMGQVIVPFISEAGVVGTATVVANVGGVAQSIQIALTGAGVPEQIILTADATIISLSGTTGITAQVLDEDGNNVPDGTAVTFTTSLSGTGVTPIATTTNGIATAIFSAGTQAGVATITAVADSASAVISITIEAEPAGSLEFVSADPTLIGVRGSALPQKATITFRVRDINGNPIADGTQVTFSLISGLGGGETLTPTVAGTTAGLVSTVLTSGTVAGPVRVLASVTVGMITLTSSSTNVSITGGPPSGAHIGVAPAFRNIAGLVMQGIICPVTAIVGDRFGNPVPQNTAVSFFTNGGVVSPQGLTDALGNAASEIKTGPPIPRAGPTPDPAITDPRTGFVTVIAVTQGEETFIDSNGNGLFDGPEEFDPADPEIDTPEPYIDHVSNCNGQPFPTPCAVNPTNPSVLSGNGMYDPDNRFELFIDGNGNGIWDTPNGAWDDNKPIFATTTILFSGPTRLTVGILQADGTCSGDPSSFTVPNGGSSAAFCFLAHDPAGRPLVGGTEISVTTSAGGISGTSGVILPDTQQGGPGITAFAFAIVDDDPADSDPPSPALVTISVSSPISATCPGGNGDLSVSFSGTVD